MNVITIGIVAGFVGFVVVLAVETLRECFTVSRARQAAEFEIARRCGASPRSVHDGRGSRSTCPGRDPHDRTTT